MEPWLQKAVDAKLLIEKNTRVRSSVGRVQGGRSCWKWTVYVD